MVMLDLGFLRANLPLVEQKLRDRGMDPREILRQFSEFDRERRAARTVIESRRAELRAQSEELGRMNQRLKTLIDFEKEEEADALGLEIQAKQKQLAEQRDILSLSEPSLEALDKKVQEILQSLPNLPHSSVPVGRSGDQ